MARESVAGTVRELLSLRPCILEALRLGIVNYSALARLLKEDVERRLGRSVSMSSLKAALLRLSSEERGRKRALEKRLSRVISESSLTLVSDIAVITLWERDALKHMDEIFAAAERARFFQMTQGVGHVTLILDVETFEQLVEKLPRPSIEAVIEGQAAVVLTSPREIIETPGVLSYITSLLASEGVNVTQVVSCHTDSIFVVDEKDSLKTYRILSNTIEKFRRALEESRLSPSSP